jgi:DNA-binding Lrp family transcriptional regulator
MQGLASGAAARQSCDGLGQECGWMRAIFVMVKCEMGQAYRVAREMADSIPELSEMHSTSGQYDLLGKFYLDADQDIGLFVVERVQSVAGVKDTYTLQTFNAFSGGRG